MAFMAVKRSCIAPNAPQQVPLSKSGGRFILPSVTLAVMIGLHAERASLLLFQPRIFDRSISRK
jgi:hypothetical protein